MLMVVFYLSFRACQGARKDLFLSFLAPGRLAHSVQHLLGGEVTVLGHEPLGLPLEQFEEDLRTVHLEVDDLLAVVPREDRVPEDRGTGEDAGADVERRLDLAQGLFVAPQERVLHVGDAERLHDVAPDERVHGRQVGGDVHDGGGDGEVSGDLDGGEGLHGWCLCPTGAVG